MKTTAPEALLPHAQPMVLLDEVMPSDPGTAMASLAIRADDRFADAKNGIPAHVAIEWMAQVCGIYAGQEAEANGIPVRLGLLLGTRRFRALQPWFKTGERLTVKAVLVLQEAGIGIFDCTVYDDKGMARAVAQLTTYQPPKGEK